MGLLDELLKAQKPKRNLMGTQMVKGPDQPYLRQDYPTVYGALGGLLGTAPDVMEGSVLDPNTAAVRQGAGYGFPVGTALGVLPMAGPAQRGAMALGRAGERLAERAVPQVMNRGGLLAEMMGAMGNQTISPIMSIPNGLTRAEQANLIQSQAENFAKKAREIGLSALVEHSGSKAGPSSYVSIFDPITGTKVKSPFRFSGHSKGPFENQFVYDVGDDFSKELDFLENMASLIPKAERDAIQKERQAKIFEKLALAEKEKVFVEGRPAMHKAMQEAKLQGIPYSKAFSNSGNYIGGLSTPQQAALDLAQQRAALPVSEGGLGLPAGNTAEQRAAAMGFDVEKSYIHSARIPFTKINEDGKFSGIFTLPNYSANYGTLDMPLVARGEIATSNDLLRLVKRPTKKIQMAIDEIIPENVDVADATVEMQKLRNELARKYGFSGVKVSDEFGGDTTALVNPDNVRSRFAAFDPFRRSAAIAATMGVAAPDLLANPIDEEELRRLQSGLLYAP